ncbi:Dabb family protein [Caballeronia sp. EK]|uniref:Dabb family protein n=1 Tax=Caballeronia jiangsuensis TaxID=1458357 RepID=A0ABW9CSB9_9BURK|nr:Dabb family protein [Caballeronia sp. EK]MBC8642282.1 Dabb family protein [Caballeronia sp. EK]
MSHSNAPVRHIVLCRFRSDVAAASRLVFFEQIGRLAEIPGIAFTNFQCGANVSPEGFGMDFADGFMMDFASRAACFAYLAHPTHRAIGERLIEALEGGAHGLLVFDITLDNHEKPAGKTRSVLRQHRDARPSRTAEHHD